MENKEIRIITKYGLTDHLGNKKILTFYDKGNGIHLRFMTEDRTPLSLDNLGLNRDQIDGLYVWAEDDEFYQIEDFIVDQTRFSIRTIK